MADAMRNGSPSAGMYILSALFIVVILLAVAGFGGRRDTEKPHFKAMSQEMAADHDRNAVRNGRFGDHAQ